MREEKQKVHAMMIFEIIGKPKEYLVKSMDNILDQLGAEEGVTIKSRNIKDPKKLEEKAGVAKTSEEGFKIKESEFYITFADVELETDSIVILTDLIFKYMPAHIEIVSPENISLSNGSWGDLLTELVQKLHAYDEVARVMQIEKAALEDKLRAFIEKSAKKTVKKPRKTSKKK